MNDVKYIKDDDLKRVREYLRLKNATVMLQLLNIGVNITLRISDLLNLKFEDIKSDNTIFIIEQKTKKSKVIKLNNTCMTSIDTLKKYYKKVGYVKYNEGFLFKSQHHKFKGKIDKPMDRSSAGRWLREARDMLNIQYPIGTHSFRKTWGYNVYSRTKDIAIVMKAFNHSSEAITLRYIGIEQEKINALYESIEI